MDLRLAAALGVCLIAALCEGASAQSLVYNGSFDEAAPDGGPAGWEAAGLEGIEQRLTVFNDPERGKVAQLTCTEFVPGSPASHVMAAQYDRVGVARGQWYRLTLWARASDLQGAAVQVALVNRRVWQGSGLHGSFVPEAAWQQFEFAFRAAQELRPEDSRLQIWFGSTGTLWLDDVELVPGAEVERRWQPELPLAGVTNAIPNSSFECGGAGWGCMAEGIPGWGAQVFRLLGAQDTSRAYHGTASWRLSLPQDAPDPLYFDYYEPIAAHVRCLLLGHEGWVPVERGKPYTFSAWVCADRAGVPVRVLVREAEGGRQQRTFVADGKWQQVALTFTASQSFACGYVGLDLRESEEESATLWVDAVQFERGPAPSVYEPRAPVEAFVETDEIGNISADPAAGLNLRLRVFNSSADQVTAKTVVSVTDFMDRPVHHIQWQYDAGPGGSVQPEGRLVPAGQRGFFKVTCESEGGLPQTIRCAVIEPYGDVDSAFGMNHAFGSEFMLSLSHLAGVTWWRDWSDKWQTVQPKPDGFDFTVPDAQIGRVLDAGGKVVLLFPFPSSYWSGRVDPRQVEEEAGGSDYERTRLPAAYKPEDLSAFARYVRASVEHYRGRIRVYEVLNEPLFTNYALPARFGYGVQDYVDVLRVAYQAAKEADPGCVVIGGIAAGPESDWVAGFVEAGGLQWCDVMNYHAYPDRSWAERQEPALKARWEQMQARGEAKPIWYTEFGLYADDDPPAVPYRAGDQTMDNAIRPSELAAAADMVRFAAIFRAYGVAKIFYHAGTQHALHESSAGNVFFEYGGAPRKQYAAQAALSRLLGPDAEFVRKWDQPEGIEAYEFRSRGRTVVILWTRKSDAQVLKVPGGYQPLDLMGNTLPNGLVTIGDMPVYLVGL